MLDTDIDLIICKGMYNKQTELTQLTKLVHPKRKGTYEVK